jgi:WD40 repeat protein
MAESIRLWDPATMREQAVLKPDPNERPWAMAFIPHSRLLAAAFGNDIILWDITDKQLREKIRLETRGSVITLDCSSDGRMMASGSSEEIIVWDMSGKKPTKRRIITPGESGGTLALSRDGKLLVEDSVRDVRKAVIIKGVKSGARLWRLDQPADQEPQVLEKAERPFAFSPDGKMLASGISNERFTRIWDISGEKPKTLYNVFGKTATVNCFAFSPDGTLLASANYDKTLCLWPLTDDARTKLKLRRQDNHGRYELGFSATSAAFSPDGKTMVLGGEDGTVRLWDVTRFAEHFPYRGHCGIISSLAFSPDVRTLVSGGYDGSVRWWNIDTAVPKQLAVAPVHKRRVFEVLYAPQGRFVVSQGEGSSEERTDIRFWELIGDQPRIREEIRSKIFTANRIAFSTNGKLFLAAGGDKLDEPVEAECGRIRRFDPMIRLWDFSSGRLSDRTTITPEHQPEDKLRFFGMVGFCELMPNAKSILYTLDKAWRVYDVKSKEGRELGMLQSDKRLGPFVSSPDGRMLATTDVVRNETPGNLTYLIRLCDLNGLSVHERLEIKLNHDNIHRLAFTPDGRHLLSLDKAGRLVFWSTASGRKIKEIQLPGNIKHIQNIPVAEIAPDGRHVAVGNPNGTIYILRLNILAETPAAP